MCKKYCNKSIYGDLRGKEKGMTNSLLSQRYCFCVYVCERERKREIIINVVE